jgi:conjugative transfer pilus assembly protein TraH
MKKLSFSFCFALLLLWGICAKADVGSQMNQMLGTMSNFTPPGATESAQRGVLSGGSLYIRSNLTNTNLVNFAPPSIQAGCSGINIFGGSLSFVSDQQFMTLLRNIPAAAAGYAFQLALNGICPECLTTLNQLQKVVQDMNQLTRNSCQMAKGLVTVGDDLVHGQDLQTAMNDSVFKGISTDFSTAFSDTNPVQTNKSAPNSVVADRITGNVVWRVANDQGINTWFAGDNGTSAQTTMQVMMSVTGTVVVQQQQSAGGGSGAPGSPTPSESSQGVTVGNDQNFSSTEYDGIVNVSDLINANSSLTYWQCSGSNATATDSSGCLTMVQSQLTGFMGFQPMMYTLLLGADGAADNDGIVFYLRNPPAGLSAAPASQQALWKVMASTPSGAVLVKIIEDLCADSPGPAITFVNEFSKLLAFQLTVRLVDDYFNATQMALTASQYTHKDDVKRRISDRQKYLQGQEATMSADLPKTRDVLEFYNSMRQFADLRSAFRRGQK